MCVMYIIEYVGCVGLQMMVINPQRSCMIFFSKCNDNIGISPSCTTICYWTDGPDFGK